jgi:dihydroflavonol-4-reductase
MATVALTGASGLLGSNLLLALVDGGHAVRATFRSEGSIAHLRRALGPRHDRVTFVSADLDDVAALTRAFRTDDGAGVDVVFHVAAAVSILRDATPALVRANVDGTRHVLAAVRAAGARRLVHTSSTVCIGLAAPGGPDADEDTTWNLREAGLCDGYAVTKKASEDLVRRAARGEDGDALDVVIVNPGYLFGPHDMRPSSGKLLLDLARGRVPGVTPGVNNFVDVRDVAAGMVAAWQRGVAGQRYILGGHNLDYGALFALAAPRAGRKPPRLTLPRVFADVVGRAGDLQAALTGREPLLTSAAIAWSYCDRFRVSSAKAQRALGYTISPLEPALDAALADFRARGLWG